MNVLYDWGVFNEQNKALLNRVVSVAFKLLTFTPCGLSPLEGK